MNYSEIESAIAALVAEVEKRKGKRIERELAPLRDTLIHARKQGVTLKQLHQVLHKKGFTYSPSAFAKYAQNHLQTEARERRRPAKEKVPSRKAATKTLPQSVGAQRGPRIASGDY